MIEEALKEFGLDDKEISVYLANLEIGQSTAGNISRKANIQRELTYIVLKRLGRKGLTNYVIKKGKKHFSVVDPDNLIRKLEEKKSLIKKALPELNALKEKRGTLKPSVEIFEGVEGIKSLLNSVARFYEKNSKEKLLEGYGSAGHFEKFLRWSLPHFINIRKKNKVKFKAIYNRTKKGIKKKKLPLADVRFLPKEFESATNYLVYPNHIAMIIFSEEPIGILIESKEIYESHKLYFQILWKQSNK